MDNMKEIVVVTECYKGRTYWIKKNILGPMYWWYTAYVDNNDNKFSSDSDVDSNINCHEGCTFFGSSTNILKDLNIDRNIFGWDYAHWNDLVTDIADNFNTLSDFINTNVMYSKVRLEDVITDCKNVIDQIENEKHNI